MKPLARICIGALSAGLVTTLTPLVAHAGCPSSVFSDCETDETAAILMTRDEVLKLQKYPDDTGSPLLEPRDPNAPRYDYLSLNDCAQARPGTPTEQVSCAHALRDCPVGEAGPLLRIWRRTLAGNTVVEPWSVRGTTCAADVAPGARPTLTMAALHG